MVRSKQHLRTHVTAPRPIQCFFSSAQRRSICTLPYSFILLAFLYNHTAVCRYARNEIYFVRLRCVPSIIEDHSRTLSVARINNTRDAVKRSFVSGTRALALNHSYSQGSSSPQAVRALISRSYTHGCEGAGGWRRRRRRSIPRLIVAESYDYRVAAEASALPRLMRRLVRVFPRTV